MGYHPSWGDMGFNSYDGTVSAKYNGGKVVAMVGRLWQQWEGRYDEGKVTTMVGRWLQ